jgi:hypothetical protein
LVDEGAVHHFQQVVVVDGVSQRSGNGLELFEIDDSVFVFIVEGKDSFDSVFGFILTDSGGDNVNELVEIEWFIFIS